MKRNDSQNEVVVITGGSAGVGRATAREFARHGAKLGLIARNMDRLEATKKEIEHLGAQAMIVSADIADAGQVESAAEEIETALGPINIWVNNAMVSVFSRVREMTPEEYLRVTQVTYLGTVHGTLSALKRMIPRNSGTIVQVGSALAHRAIPLQSAYCAAKHAVEGFTESLRSELLHDGCRIRLTMVQLPALNTPQFEWEKSRLPRKPQPVPPIYQPEVAAKAIYWAARHNRREVNVGYPTSLALILNKFFPRLLDHYLAKTGFNSQMTSEPRDPAAPHNLWDSVPGDFSAHGRFDQRAHAASFHFWLNTHRILLYAAGAAIAAKCFLGRKRRC